MKYEELIANKSGESDENEPEELMLTTFDNKKDPFTEYDAWFVEDERLARLNSRPTVCEMLGNFAQSSPELSDLDNRIAINAAIIDLATDPFLCATYKIARKSQN